MRIAYGVASEGMGHATRSQSVIDRLIRHGHSVEIFSSDRAYDFFEKKGYRVHRVKGFHLIYEGNRLANAKSALAIVKNLPQGLLPAFRTVAHEFSRFRPHVVVSDFEFFTAFAGKAAGIPVITANNISIIDRTRVHVPVKGLASAKRAAIVSARLLTFNADWYVIPTFFYPPIKGTHVVLTDPTVRDTIATLKPTRGKHILVYQTTPTALRLLRMLKSVPEQFHIYGYGEKPKEGNLTFYPFSDAAFARQLAGAKAVITGGGFSLISEALYLRKPILSVPLADHYEQIMNGHYLRHLGYGDYAIEPTKEDVTRFLSRVGQYEKRLATATFNPSAFGTAIEKIATRIHKEPDPVKLIALRLLVGKIGKA